MFRKRSTDQREMPSLIQEIVIYDKPNKPVVPETILPQSSQINYGKGDIILTRSKRKATKVPLPLPIKNEPLNSDPNDSEAEGRTKEAQPAAPPISVDDLNEIIREYLEDESSEEESIENITKEVSKLSPDVPKRTPKKAAVRVEKTVDKPVEKVEFKKPRGRPRKSENANTPQKRNILSYFKKVPAAMEVIVDNGDGGDSDSSSMSSGVEASPSEEVRGKRVRRMPKKYEDEDILLDEKSLGRYSQSGSPNASPLKKKRFAELTIVPIYSQDPSDGIDSEQIDELLNDTDEQIRALKEVGTEIQTLVQRTPRGKKVAASPRKSAKSTRLKNEVADDDTDASSVVELNEDDFGDSDEDSRCEWVPEEYAEYKRQHNIKMSKVQKCKFCSMEFGSYYALRKHRALEHDDLVKDRKESTYGGGEPAADASEVDGSDEESSRGEWMPEDYAEYKLKHNLNKQKRVQWYKCKICCAVFPNYYKLAKHRVEHDQNDPYKCKTCDASFNDVETFTAHLRVHQGKDPYNCRKCGKGFETKNELIEHEPVHVLKKDPEPEKRFRCDVCNKEFRKLCDIERHTRVHTGEKPAECNICHKRFQQTHNLSKHLLTHLHVRPFQCEICNKKFGRIDVLNRHLLTHSVEKPYKCVLCNKGFIRQVQVTNHMEKHHADNVEDGSIIESIGDEMLP